MWIVSHIWNGKSYVDRYESYDLALLKFTRLIMENKKPSLHRKEQREKKEQKEKEDDKSTETTNL